MVALGHVRVDVDGRVALLLVTLVLVRPNGCLSGSRILSPVAWNAMSFEERRLRTLLKCCLLIHCLRQGLPTHGIATNNTYLERSSSISVPSFNSS